MLPLLRQALVGGLVDESGLQLRLKPIIEHGADMRGGAADADELLPFLAKFGQNIARFIGGHAGSAANGRVCCRLVEVAAFLVAEADDAVTLGRVHGVHVAVKVFLGRADLSKLLDCGLDVLFIRNVEFMPDCAFCQTCREIGIGIVVEVSADLLLHFQHGVEIVQHLARGEIGKRFLIALGQPVKASALALDLCGKRLAGDSHAVYKSRKVKVAMGALIMAGYAQHIINLLAGDDDDGENAYLKMLRNAPWEFERNIVIFIPGTKEYIKFPLGFGMNAFWHLGVQGGAVTSGNKGFLDATLDSTRVAFDAFNPLGSGGWISMALPTIIDPIWELGTNENFSGNPIYPIENQYDPAPPPKSEQAFKGTAPVFKDVAEFMNKWSGGSEVLPGAVDVYPDSLEYLWGWFTGGIGRFASQTAETAQRGVDLEFEPKKTPFVRSFYGEVDDAGKRSEYFAQREKVQFVKGKAKEFGEAGDEQALNDFIESNRRDYDAINAFDMTEKQRRKLNKQRRRIEKQEPENSKTLLEEIDKQELELMNEARKAYFELGKKGP